MLRGELNGFVQLRMQYLIIRIIECCTKQSKVQKCAPRYFVITESRESLRILCFNTDTIDRILKMGNFGVQREDLSSDIYF